MAQFRKDWARYVHEQPRKWLEQATWELGHARVRVAVGKVYLDAVFTMCTRSVSHEGLFLVYVPYRALAPLF